MFRYSPKEVNGQIGYVMPLDLVLDYFGGFGEIVDFSSLTQTFAYFNALTHFVMKLIEKLYFIPVVHRKDGLSGGSFRIVYEPIISNKESAKIINQLENSVPDNLFIKGDKPKDFVEKFVREYLTHLDELSQFHQIKQHYKDFV